MQRDGLKRNILPPTYLFIYLLLAFIVHFFCPIYHFSSIRFLGLIPLLIGIWINLLADNSFKKHNTTVKPDQTPSKLINQGIFSYSRHPMYLGFVLILLGVAIILASLSALISPLLMFVTLAVKFIPLEEAMLGKKFGKEYLKYRQQVRRWFSFHKK